MKTPIHTQIKPQDIFLPYFSKEFTEAELWMGASRNQFGNRPSGSSLIDHFAGIIRQNGNIEIIHISRKMGIETIPLIYTIQTLTGLSPREWVDWWVLTATCEMLEKTNWTIKTIANKLNFSSPGALTRYFTRHKKTTPTAWRYRKTE